MNLTEKVSSLVESQKDELIKVSDQIWEFAETRFEEFQSAELVIEMLEREVAGLETGFIASLSLGNPVIAILG
jgi:aminobenzoyl-glutamate utilization protein B